MKQLDLSFNADLSENHSKIFSSLARDKIKQFNKLIGRLYSNVNKKYFLLWVISNTSSRNPYTSKIFYYYLSFFFLKKIIKKTKFQVIIVDSLIQKKLFKKILKNKNIKIKVQLKKKKNNFRFIKFFFRFLIIKISRLFEINKFFPTEVSLIMTYVLDGYVKKSRYFPGLFERIKSKKNIFFVPNIVIFSFFSLIKNLVLLRREKNYILKEDYISFFDLISILNINKNIRSIFKKNYLNKNILKDLVVEELLLNMNNFSYLESLMNFIFLRNLKSKGIKIKTSIVWFENQSFERSWSYALNKYFKNSKNIGYMGIVPADMYISQDHTLPEDRNYKLIPEKILTIGNYFRKNIKKFDSKLVTKNVTALSFQHLFNKKVINKKNQILVALPILEKDSENILKICKNLMKKKYFFKYKLIIRPHPTQKGTSYIKKIKDYNIKGSELDNNKNFYDTLKKSKYFIGGMSSTCLEAIIFNIPTIIYKSNDYLKSSCIPKFINNKYYLYSNDYLQIVQFIKNSKNKPNQLPNNIRKNFFNSVSNNLLSEFNL